MNHVRWLIWILALILTALYVNVKYSFLIRSFTESVIYYTESTHLEPPVVQQQMNHYSLMAQKLAVPTVNMEETKIPDTLLHCDLCNFKTKYLFGMQRHYLKRHGMKMLTCEDCNFFTSSRYLTTGIIIMIMILLFYFFGLIGWFSVTGMCLKCEKLCLYIYFIH